MKLTPIRAKIVTKVMIVSTNRPLTIRLIVFLTLAFGFDSIPTGFLIFSREQHLVRHRCMNPVFTSTCYSIGKKSDLRSMPSFFYTFAPSPAWLPIVLIRPFPSSTELFKLPALLFVTFASSTSPLSGADIVPLFLKTN